MENYTLTLIIIVLCVVLSGYFSATETAFSSLNRIKVKNMASKGNKRAAQVLAMAQNYDAVLSTILIGNNIVNIACASLATVLFVQLLGSEYGPGVSTLAVTIVVLIFGEISPKSIAKEAPEKFAMFSAPILQGLMVVCTPLNFLFRQWKKLLSAVFKTSEDNTITEEELLTYVHEAEQSGGIAEQQGTLIRNAIEFTDLEVYEVMTPRTDIVGVEMGASKAAVAEAFSVSGYSRLPVYRESLDRIVGVVYLKDFYNFIYHKEETLEHIVRNVMFCTKSHKTGRLMRQLQLEKLHIAVVVDEYGGTVGLVTLEDMLEALVGEIWDEHDEVVVDIEELAKGQYAVMGSASITELFRHLGRQQEFTVVTASGWVTTALGRIPKTGETLLLDGLEVTVQEMAGHCIQKMLVSTPLPPPV